MPMKMPTMDKIMMTSMATANTLMTERMGRWSKLAKMSLFMVEPGTGAHCRVAMHSYQGQQPGLGRTERLRARFLPNSHYYKSVFKPAKIEPLAEESF